MTSSASTHSAPAPKRREQVVAAALVGAVVILLGFASGLGVDPIRSFASSGVPAPGSTGAASSLPAIMLPTPAPTTRPPVNYVGVALPGSGTDPSNAAATPSTTHMRGSRSSSPAHAAGSTTATALPTTPAPCPSDLLASLLASIAGASSPGAGGGLLSIGGLLDMLTGGLSLGLPTLSLSALLNQVTHLLSVSPVLPGVGSLTGSSSSALASACTTALSKIVPITGGGG